VVNVLRNLANCHSLITECHCDDPNPEILIAYFQNHCLSIMHISLFFLVSFEFLWWSLCTRGRQRQEHYSKGLQRLLNYERVLISR